MAIMLTVACSENKQESESAARSTEPRADAAISTSVQARFYQDDTVRGREIDVSTQDGVVTLEGSVENEAAKRRAVELARGVDGVTRVNDELQVRPDDTPIGTSGSHPDRPRLDPSAITARIQAQYFREKDLKPLKIGVTTNRGGVVTLEGTVDTAENKADALRIARETDGVVRVEDQLKVAGEPSASKTGRTDMMPPDAWLTAKIQAKYFVDDEVKGRNIDVDTQNGVVTLKGAVATDSEKRQAVSIARNTDGVNSVTDELRLDPSMQTANLPRESAKKEPAQPGTKPMEAAADSWITMKVQSKYFLDADVKGSNIDVDTRDGIVTLKGTVENAAQKKMAEQIARETSGVKRVVNQLSVSTN
jgi:osmotically-inducible protein OsmY